MKTLKNSKPPKARGARNSTPTSASNEEGDRRETILVSVTGQSPAVLTETIWALAHEKPAIIPQRVVTITTTEGRKALIRELFEPSENCVWDQLCAALQAEGHDLSRRLKFGQTADDIRVFTWFDPVKRRKVELPDITNGDQNAAAADFIMEQVRGLAADNVRLIGSVAGGRKTMGALLFAVMSLIGRRDDLMTHVLINDPFDSPGLKPRFYFPPRPPVEHVLTDRSGNPVKDDQGNPISKRSDEAKIQIARIPFVALRTLFERDVQESPTYGALVQRCQLTSDEYARNNVRLSISRRRLLVNVNGREIKTSLPQHLYLLFLAERAKRNEPHLASYAAAYTDFNQFCTRTHAERDSRDGNDWRDGAQMTHTLESMERYCVKMKNELKLKLEKSGPRATLLYTLLPATGRLSLDLPTNAITIQD